MADVGVLANADVLLRGDRIAAVGPYAEVRREGAGAAVVEIAGVLFPGFVDCHTHAVFAAPRLDDHQRRALGETYQAIAAAGGGILQSVRDVRAMPEETLVALTVLRVASMLAHGTTTVEIKSGYGLELESELKQLRVAQRVADAVPVTVVSTFLGAHEVPPEYRGACTLKRCVAA